MTTYQYSKDILPTFMDMIGLNISPYFRGRSMLREATPRKCIVTEYMGPGCPDIIQRPVWFSARDEHYVIAYKVKLSGLFADCDLCEVYDKVRDSKEYYNIVVTIDRSKVQYLLDEIALRFEELKSDTTKYYELLKESESGIPININL